MRYRKLGQTKLKVSEISIGCSGYWGNKHFSEYKAEQIILKSIERGVNFFDTGHNYSNFNAEPRLGRILKNHLKTQDRSGLVISSKAGTFVPRAPIFNSKKTITDFSPIKIRESCLKSIDNLNCEYLDIFQLHAISQTQITEELISTLSEMKHEGLFNYLGINIHSQYDMQYVVHHSDWFDMILLDYNVLQIDREPIINSLAQAGIGIIAGTVLAQGHLIQGKIGKIKSFADIWYLARALLKPTGRLFLKNSKQMQEYLASFDNLTAAQVAFLYVLNNTNISSCVFGTTNLKHLNEVLEISKKSISDENMQNIRSIYKQMNTIISH
jgi:aryl-alcohol dehydrogenase-like predicted oxidoreductase